MDKQTVEQTPPPPPAAPPAVGVSPSAMEKQTVEQTSPPPHAAAPSVGVLQAAEVSPAETGEEAARWGTANMGPPSAPWVNPENQQAAMGGPHRGDEDSPYIIMDRSTTMQHGGGPIESILEAFDSWTKAAETLACNVWTNLKTAPSKTGVAWGKLSLTAKALSEGGFESLFRQTFPTSPNEKLRKSFACYLATTTGPVAGTLYLSDLKLAFCSDRPLSFAAPSGQQAWSYYKVVLPFDKVRESNPVTLREKPVPENYVQIVTVDAHEFWFMGFVSYDKAVAHIIEALGEVAVARRAAGHQ